MLCVYVWICLCVSMKVINYCLALGIGLGLEKKINMELCMTSQDLSSSCYALDSGQRH